MSYVNFRTRRTPALLQYLGDLGRYRHLCWNLVGSDLRSRFRRSRLGILWAIIQPLCFALTLAYVYGQLFGQTNYLQYAVYVFSGMILWEFFTTSITVGLDAILNAGGYLKQARIPFFIFQLRVPLGSFVIFLAGCLGLLGLLIATQQLPPLGPQLALVPAFWFFMLALGAPTAILFSLIGTQFRDVRYITGIVLQAMFFLSPVFIDRAFMQQEHVWLLKYINPFVPLVDMFRAPILYGQYWNPESIFVLSCWIAGLWAAAGLAAAVMGRKVIYSI